MRCRLLAGGCISPVKAVFGGACGASGGLAVDGGCVNWLKVSSAAFIECSSDCNGAINENRGILEGGASISPTIAMDDDEPSPTPHGPPQQDQLAE